MNNNSMFCSLRGLGAFLVGLAFLTTQSCNNPFSIAMHDPIYPSTNQNVTYTLEMLSGTAPSEVKLYEQVTILNVTQLPMPFGPPIQIVIPVPAPETLLQTWTNPSLGTLSHSKTSPNPANSLVTYRFEVKQKKGGTAKHKVTYATRDYPLTDAPAPVYVVGSADNTFDVVFIPDEDITNMNTFRNHCRGMIRDAFFNEPTTRVFRNSFNFYINPHRGRATDFDRIAIDGQHQVPSNNANLAFAEGRVLMHQNDLRDYASGGLFSTEMQNRGTMLHESGHGLFSLADEYPGGAHWQSDVLPNNWNSLAGAQADAPNRGKAASDASKMGADNWWKICIGDCQMNRTGLNHTSYDRPCIDRIINQIVEKSRGN